jgi:hypothetical protein
MLKTTSALLMCTLVGASAVAEGLVRPPGAPLPNPQALVDYNARCFDHEVAFASHALYCWQLGEVLLRDMCIGEFAKRISCEALAHNGSVYRNHVRSNAAFLRALVGEAESNQP